MEGVKIIKGPGGGITAEVHFTDYSDQVLEALGDGVKNALTAIGLTAESHAKHIITWHHAVDTGRLRNSITFATKSNEGSTHTYKDDNQETYSQDIGSGIGENELYIGTNVEYAPGIEYGTHRKAGAVHFLQKAATNYNAEYKQLAKEALENA